MLLLIRAVADRRAPQFFLPFAPPPSHAPSPSRRAAAPCPPPLTRFFKPDFSLLYTCNGWARHVHQPPNKKLKHQKLIKVKDAKTRNNGDIDIVPLDTHNPIKHSPEEVISQGLRYQVPEQLVILDFWSKVQRDRYGQ